MNEKDLARYGALVKKPTRFAKGTNRGTAVCADCKKRTWESRIDRSTGLCERCYDEAGLENEHSDGYHADSPSAACHDCHADGHHVAGFGDAERCRDCRDAKVKS